MRPTRLVHRFNRRPCSLEWDSTQKTKKIFCRWWKWVLDHYLLSKLMKRKGEFFFSFCNNGQGSVFSSLFIQFLWGNFEDLDGEVKFYCSLCSVILWREKLIFFFFFGFSQVSINFELKASLGGKKQWKGRKIVPISLEVEPK